MTEPPPCYLHNKVASWVARSFHLVVLPEFITSKMVSPSLHGCRTVNTRSRRAIMTWGHFCCQQWLLDISQRYSKVKAFLANEAMIMRQCGECGAVNIIGRAEVFTCTVWTSSPSGHLLSQACSAAYPATLRQGLIRAQVGELQLTLKNDSGRV